jgi:hypothetical protein
MKRLFAILTVAALLGLGLTGCDLADTAPEGNESQGTAAPTADSSSPTANSNAPFPVFHQGFNQGVEPWVGNETPGPFGWCGTIERVDRRSGSGIAPSAGRAYATVEDGPCNDFYAFIPGSAPASGPDPELLSTTWPRSGFVQQLDIYLDPEGYGTDEGFTYANSVCTLTDGSCVPGPTAFTYFAIQVVKDGDDLLVAGQDVGAEPGWYTFRHVFGSEGGTLTVDFELVENGQPLLTTPITTTFRPGPPGESDPPLTSSFDVADLGSGYIWFVSIAKDLKLPIDEHILRRGR